MLFTVGTFPLKYLKYNSVRFCTFIKWGLKKLESVQNIYQFSSYNYIYLKITICSIPIWYFYICSFTAILIGDKSITKGLIFVLSVFNTKVQRLFLCAEYLLLTVNLIIIFVRFNRFYYVFEQWIRWNPIIIRNRSRAIYTAGCHCYIKDSKAPLAALFFSLQYTY